MSLETMLFGLKEVTKDTDAVEVKKEIDYHLTQLTESDNTVNKEKEIEFVKKTVSAVSTSFKKRQQQLLTDTEIVHKINLKIDGFRKEHEVKVEGLLSSLMREIDVAVDNYGDEIVRRLDPTVIKKRFKKKEDFELWLTTINDSYKEAMEKTVDRKTQSAIRSYLVDAEYVFETASSYLSDREVLISVEDTFYGTLSTSKNIIAKDINNKINELTVYNKSLYNASEDLFNSIWQARKKYDAKRYTTTAVSTIVGAGGVSVAAGMATAAGIVAVDTAAKAGGVMAAKAMSMAAASLGGLPIIAGIAAFAISGIIIAVIASKLSAAIYSDSFEKDVQACIKEFTDEINKSKLAMQEHITESIKLIFDNELKSLDRTFLEFRRATYIDQDRVPQIAERLEKLEKEVGVV